MLLQLSSGGHVHWLFKAMDTDSRTTPVGDSMQMNQHEILLGVAVSQCFSPPVIRLFIASGAAQGQLIVCVQVSTDVLQVAKIKPQSSNFLTKISSDCDAVALVCEPVESFMTLTPYVFVSTAGPSASCWWLVSR